MSSQHLEQSIHAIHGRRGSTAEVRFPLFSWDWLALAASGLKHSMALACWRNAAITDRHRTPSAMQLHVYIIRFLLCRSGVYARAWSSAGKLLQSILCVKRIEHAIVRRIHIIGHRVATIGWCTLKQEDWPLFLRSSASRSFFCSSTSGLTCRAVLRQRPAQSCFTEDTFATSLRRLEEVHQDLREAQIQRVEIQEHSQLTGAAPTCSPHTKLLGYRFSCPVCVISLISSLLGLRLGRLHSGIAG